MGKIIKIGIVGCGAIGKSLAKRISSDFKGAARLAGVYDIDDNKADSLAVSLGAKVLALSSIDKLKSLRPAH